MKSIAPLPLLFIAWGSLSGAPSPDLPQLILPQGAGVNIHFTRGHERDLDLIAAAGFKFIRMDFGWGGTERRKGDYNWGDYDALTANLEKRGLRAVYILDYSNGLYEDTVVSRSPIGGQEQRDTASPRKPESFEAFARWAAAAATHFKDRRIIWEIWNEPNIGFWKPAPNVTNYAKLVLATCKAVRAADPQATIIAPAASGFPWPFFEELFKAGALEHLDAVSVHPYRGYSQGPETAVKDYRRLRGLIERYAPDGRKAMPILSGEWGYATHAKGGVTLETQAAFIARQQLANLYHGVPLSIWYDWKNDGTNPSYNEDNFGTVSNNLALKPSYVAVQTLTRELSGYRIARRLDTGHPDSWLLLCVNTNGDQKLAAWTTSEPRQAVLTLKLSGPESVSAVNGQGQPVSVKVEQGGLRLSLRPAPQYVTFKQRLPELSAAAAWERAAMVSLVEAGVPMGLKVPVKLRNPFDHPLRAEITLRGLPNTSPPVVTDELPPGVSRQHLIVHSVERRWPDALPATLIVKLDHADPPGDATPLGSWSEDLEFVLANPLQLSLAPVEDGLQLSIGNPSRSVFTGQAVAFSITPRDLEASRPRWADEAKPVHLTHEQPDATLKLANRGPHSGVQLVEAGHKIVAQIPVPTYRSVPLQQGRAALDGDAKVTARASLVLTNAPGGTERPYAQAWQLDYEFDAGWRFVRVVADAPRSIRIEGHPQALGMWVYGDGSRNALRIRVSDDAKQTFQPSGPELTWTGWRWVTFDLADMKHAGHWGGPDDGAVHGALQIDTLLLVDGTRQKTAGTVCFAGPAFLYAAQSQ
jgi:polysaccharide biosynthesis protein PslG